jgi:predicted DNA-binding transcriptional regulator AlpA
MTKSIQQLHAACNSESLSADTQHKPQAKAPIGFDALPDGAFVRLSQLVRDPKKPDAPTPLPFSAATAWRMIKAGTFVAPVKLGPRVTCFSVGLVRNWLALRSGE